MDSDKTTNQIIEIIDKSKRIKEFVQGIRLDDMFKRDGETDIRQLMKLKMEYDFITQKIKFSAKIENPPNEKEIKNKLLKMIEDRDKDFGQILRIKQFHEILGKIVEEELLKKFKIDRFVKIISGITEK